MFPFLDLSAQLRLGIYFHVGLDFGDGHLEIDGLLGYAGN